MLVGSYAVSASDGRGGSASSIAYATVRPEAAASQPPSGTLSVSPTSGPAGTVVTVSFPAVDSAGNPAVWDVWHTTYVQASGRCCFSGTSTNVTFPTAGAYRLTSQAVDKKLNFSNRQSTVIRIGGATGTPPIINAAFDRLSGTAPFTVNIDMSASTDPDGSLQSYLVLCDYDVLRYGPGGPRSSCTYDTPGTYWLMLQVKDNEGLLDLMSAYVSVQPAGDPAPGNKQPATITLSNLSRTYTGSPLAPTATTNPPGLPVSWTNAPQTNVGSYAVTATVNDPGYEGSASGTFIITKATASVTLGGLNQTYTGQPLSPTATTNPPGLAVIWTNAPQTAAGSYSVTATVSDSNYQGSASGTFVIGEPSATVTLGNLTQAYTGQPLTPTATTNPPGLRVVWTNAPQTNSGTYSVTATIDDPNYQGSASGAFVISKAPGTLTLSNLSQTYTGQPLAPSVTTNPPGLAVTWTNAPQTNVGTYAVTATISDPNYQGSASGAFVIGNPTATVTLSNLTQTYTGRVLMPTVTTQPPGLKVTWTNAPQTNAGSYAVTATIDDPNYHGSAGGTFVINKAAGSVSLSSLNQTYIGQPLTPKATTNPQRLAITWTNAPQTNAGSYVVTATINDPNYEGSASASFVISKATATVGLGNLTQRYTGNPLKPTAATTPAGLVVSLTNAPQIQVGSYLITASIDDPNYQGSADGTFTITPAVSTAVPPSVSITSPVNNSLVNSGTVVIRTAVTQGTNPIAKVDFLVNGVVKCSVTTGPFSCSWNMPGATGRTYELRAKAYDTAGIVGESASVTITSSR
jgi:uncharacterized protein with FMN-binding domain